MTQNQITIIYQVRGTTAKGLELGSDFMSKQDAEEWAEYLRSKGHSATVYAVPQN